MELSTPCIINFHPLLFFAMIVFMLESIKQLLYLAAKTDKIWLIPILLLLVIIALLIITAQISPVPIFLYPII